MADKFDMTAMYVGHHALRRDLGYIARTTARIDDDPRRLLGTAYGWELFKKALHIHHQAEDEALWPAMREAAEGRPDDLALLDAMESEHAAIDPLLDAIDAAIADRDGGPQRLGNLTDALHTSLTGHLSHEEAQALPLIQARLNEAQWQHFGQVGGRLAGPDASRVVPWMLDGASEQDTAKMLAPLPEPVRLTYENEWRPAYAALDRWNEGTPR
jgi:iron-sulfur cluster repair protein YtfE (RIC family)